jgi:integrase
VIEQMRYANVESESALDALVLLLLTGARRDEVREMQWNQVQLDAASVLLEDSKTGQKRLVLGKDAIELLKRRRESANSAFVFPGSDPAKPFRNLRRVWLRILKRASVEDARIHDLRHAFATTAIAAGAPLRLVGELLGHADHRMTLRYAHVADDAARAAADQTAGTIAGLLVAKAKDEGAA